MTLGTVMRTEFQKPRERPSQFRPVQAVAQALIHGSKVGSLGGAKVKPSLISGIVRVYDLVVAQTSGGPGIASEVPAKYVYDAMFLSQNLGQGFAASTMMLLSVVIVILPWAYFEFGRRRQHV